MGSLYGEEKVQLDTDIKQSADQLEDGLYVILGNDSSSMDSCIIMITAEY